MSLVEVLGALGIFITTVLAALGGWWIKLSNNRHQQVLEIRRLETERDLQLAKTQAAIAAKTDRTKAREYSELNERQVEMLEERGKEIHELRDRLNKAELKQKVTEQKELQCQQRVTHLEQIVTEWQTRFEEIFAYTEDHEEALANAKIPVIRRRRPLIQPSSKTHAPLPSLPDNEAST